jgi:arsenate reductase
MMGDLTVREIAPAEPDLFAALLGAGLPTDDLDQPSRTFFAFRTDEGETVGYAGAELAGDAALLRSVVVLAPRRGRGLARRITEWALRWLDGRGVRDVYLLTIDAMPVFEKCGFRAVDRSEAPQPIRASRQFSALCPASAILMRRKEKA